MNKSDQLGELFQALAKAQAELKAVPFDSRNPHFKNEFASLTAIQEATRPILAKHNLSITQLIDSDGSDTWLHTILGHSSGQFVQGSLKLVVAKNDMQQIGSANTYARRYAWQDIIGVAGDADDDAETAVGRHDKPLVNYAPQTTRHNDLPPQAYQGPPDDGAPWGEANNASNEDIGQFQIKFGKDSGKTLNELGAPTVASKLDWAKKNVANPIGAMLEFMQAAEIFLKQDSENFLK